MRAVPECCSPCPILVSSSCAEPRITARAAASVGAGDPPPPTPRERRTKLALDLGASVVFDPGDEDILDKIRQETDGHRGVDKAMDCSGSSDAHRLMIDAVQRRGEASFIGEGKDFPLFASSDMLRKGISLHGIWHYNLSDSLNIIKVIEQNSDKLDKFITHKFPMSEVQKAWELQAKMKCGKVLLNPWS